MPVPPADFAGAITLSGKLAFKIGTTTETGICPGPPGTWFDLVGWGTANCSETSPATSGWGVTTALVRLDGGCTDTDDNSADFMVGTPNPRNSLSTPLACP